MNGKPDYRDQRVLGGNPCLEQSLESMELCCLVETFPDKHETLEVCFVFSEMIPNNGQQMGDQQMDGRLKWGCFL